ncbi:hypothetical protein LCGC14_1721870, partial [marine sediment metagenome]
GTLSAMDTSTGSPSVNDPIYVANGGGWTKTKPTGTDLIQIIGIIARVHGSQGIIVMVGAGRTNDVPNSYRFVALQAFGLSGGGGGLDIAQGVKKIGYRIPFDCTLTSIQMLSGDVGDIVIDIWSVDYATYNTATPRPAVGDSITSATPLTLSSADKVTDSTLTSWSINFTKGDIWWLNVDSVSGIKSISITPFVTRT